MLALRRTNPWRGGRKVAGGSEKGKVFRHQVIGRREGVCGKRGGVDKRIQFGLAGIDVSRFDSVLIGLRRFLYEQHF